MLAERTWQVRAAASGGVSNESVFPMKLYVNLRECIFIDTIGLRDAMTTDIPFVQKSEIGQNIFL